MFYFNYIILNLVVTLVYPILKKTLFLFLRLFLKEIKGAENIPKNGSFIITSNYESYLDPWLIDSVIIPLKNKKYITLPIKVAFGTYLEIV